MRFIKPVTLNERIKRIEEELTSLMFSPKTELNQLLKHSLEKELDDLRLERMKPQYGHIQLVAIAKGNYKSKDGTIKKAIEKDGFFYAPIND